MADYGDLSLWFDFTYSFEGYGVVVIRIVSCDGSGCFADDKAEPVGAFGESGGVFPGGCGHGEGEVELFSSMGCGYF